MDPTDRDLTERVLQRGRAAGLAAVGVTSAEPFEATRQVLESRRAAGLHGGMAFTYRNPARSTDPARTLPSARSLVVGAYRYPSGPRPGGDRPAGSAAPRARVARYAAADHYGRLRHALGAVAEELCDAGFRAVVLADDNALVDRAAAHRAGLGWFGKNSNLLAPGLGSWFVLGSVLTDAILGPHTQPVADGCGACRRCLDGCPTGAIVAPGVVDARRCLAWHLQMDGEFPRRYRAALGDRIYGCDECQEVCPPNLRVDRLDGSGPDDPGPDGPDTEGGTVDVLELLGATDDELLERHGRWYIPRRDPRYLRRNALVVLGNTAPAGRGSALDRVGRAVDEVLASYLRGPDELLAAHAAWAAIRLGRLDLLQEHEVAARPVVRTELAAARADGSGEDGTP